MTDAEMNALIARNRALLRRAAGTWAYAALLFEETAELVLAAHVAQLRAWHRVRRRRPAAAPFSSDGGPSTP